MATMTVNGRLTMKVTTMRMVTMTMTRSMIQSMILNMIPKRTKNPSMTTKKKFAKINMAKHWQIRIRVRARVLKPKSQITCRNIHLPLYLHQRAASRARTKRPHPRKRSHPMIPKCLPNPLRRYRQSRSRWRTF